MLSIEVCADMDPDDKRGLGGDDKRGLGDKADVCADPDLVTRRGRAKAASSSSSSSFSSSSSSSSTSGPFTAAGPPPPAAAAANLRVQRRGKEVEKEK